MSGDEPIEFDKEELKKYLNEVIKVKRDHASDMVHGIYSIILIHI